MIISAVPLFLTKRRFLQQTVLEPVHIDALILFLRSESNTSSLRCPLLFAAIDCRGRATAKFTVWDLYLLGRENFDKIILGE